MDYDVQLHLQVWSLRWIAGAKAPAFIERGTWRRPNATGRVAGIAGAKAPAFIERANSRRPTHRTAPGLRGRRPPPSLSGDQTDAYRHKQMAGIAGAKAPAFIERTGQSPSR